jgi:hypothetical protein
VVDRAPDGRRRRDAIRRGPDPTGPPRAGRLRSPSALARRASPDSARSRPADGPTRTRRPASPRHPGARSSPVRDAFRDLRSAASLASRVS